MARISLQQRRLRWFSGKSQFHTTANGCPPLLEGLEPRALLASTIDHPIGINFNDEAMWEGNFSTAVAEAKALGVTAVRLWISFSSYDARPNAWDPPPSFVNQVALRPNYCNATQTIMKRAFELHRAGFDICIVLTPDEGKLPTSTQQVKNLIAHFRDATEKPTSMQTLADVVDFWEIGNEPDLLPYWSDPSPDDSVRIRNYVDKLLIPAAQTLRQGTDPSRWEKVISGGISWNGENVKTVLQHLKDRNALGLIDLAGYHPYGRYDPEIGDYQQVARTTSAAKYAKQYGKELAGTEWNVRGFTSSTDPAKWARAMDASFRDLIVGNFRQIYYFCLVNNYAVRNGKTSARPGGVLKHDAPSTPLWGASPAKKEQWYQTPLIRSQPLYSTFWNWQWGTVSGTVKRTGGAAVLSGQAVYVDVNDNRTLDSSEPRTTTGADGRYALKYGSREVPAGIHAVRIVVPKGWTTLDGDYDVRLRALNSTGNVNFTLEPGKTGAISGRVFHDPNRDGRLNTGEAGLANRTLYIDLDNDKVLDANEPSARSASDGGYTIGNLVAGYYNVRQIVPAGWSQTTPGNGYGFKVTLAAGHQFSGVRHGSYGGGNVVAAAAASPFCSINGFGYADACASTTPDHPFIFERENVSALDAAV